jgi:hypothetical protein
MAENSRCDLCITSKTLTQIDPGEKNRAPDLVPGGNRIELLGSIRDYDPQIGTEKSA